MSTTTLRLRKTLVILVSLALLLAPNIIAFADDTPTGEQGTPTPEATSVTEDSSGGEEDQSGGGEDQSGGEEDQSGGEEDQSGGEEDQSGGEEDQSGGEEDQSGGEEDQSGGEEDQSGGEEDQSGGEEDQSGGEEPPVELLMAKSLPPVELDGGGEKGWDKTLTLSKSGNGNGYFSYKVYKWHGGFGGGGWELVSQNDSYIGGQIQVDSHAKVNVTAIASSGSFKRWSSISGGGSSNDASIEIYMNGWDQSATAVFELPVETHTVTFYDYNDTQLGTVTVTHGNDASPIDDPEREGYEFAGWSPAGNLQNVTSDVSVKATYNAKPILEFYYVEGLSGYTCSAGTVAPPTAGNPTTIYADIGSTVTVSASSINGYSYNGLLTTGGYSASPVNNAASGTTYKFKAIITVPTHTLTFSGSHCYYTVEDDLTGHHYVGGEKIENIPHGAEYTVTAHATGLYEFANDWDHKPSGATGTNPITFTMNADDYVDAKMKEIDFENTNFHWSGGLSKYTYSYTINGTPYSGDVTPSYHSYQSVSLPRGYEVTVTAVSISGYNFKEWQASYSYYHNSSTSTQKITPVSGDGIYNVKANFVEIPTVYDMFFDFSDPGIDHYSYTVDTGSGAGTPIDVNSQQTVSLTAGAEVVVTAHSKELYSNNSWYNDTNADSTTVNTATFTMDGNKKAHAKFTFDGYHLKLDITDHISSYTVKYNSTTQQVYSDQTLDLPKDVDVTVTANPQTNYVFDYWDDSYSTPPTGGRNGNLWPFNMDGDHQVRAYGVKLTGEQFTIHHQSYSGSTGSGNVEVYYKGIKQATLSPGESVDVTYDSNYKTVKVKACPNNPSKFVQWRSHDQGTLPEMIINLETGQGTSKCWPVIDIVVIPEFEMLGSLTVYKVETGTSTLLAGASFELRNSGGTAMPLTDIGSTDGVFGWSSLPAGTYTLKELSAPNGYNLPSPNTWTITIGPGSKTVDVWNITKTIENEPDHCSLDVKKVNSETNAVIASHAMFKLTSTNGYFNVQVSNDGTFFWDDLEPGNYQLTELFAPNGYYWITRTHDITLTTDTSGWPEIKKDIVNYEYASIKVVKTENDSQTPMAGVEFTLTKPGGGTDVKTTDSNGEILWDELLPGDYNVTETVPSGYYTTVSSSKDVTLTNGQDEVINITNYEYASIKVVKTENDSQTPMAGVEFTLTKPDGGTDVKTTDSNGEILWDELLPGDYNVTETVPSGYYTTVSSSKDVTLTNGQDEVINITNYEYASIKVVKIVKTENDSQTPMAGVEFTLTKPDGGTDVKTTDSNGEILWDELLPGDYNVTETVPSGYYTAVSSSKDVTLTHGQHEVINITNYEYASIKVVKTENDGQTPMAGVEFTLTKPGGGTDVKTTDSNGEILWDELLPGDYNVTETVPSGYYTTVSTSKDVTLTHGQHEVINITNYEFVSIQIIKRDNRNGNPLAGAVFSIEEAELQSRGGVLGTVTTGPDGKALFAYPDFQLRAGVTYLIKEVQAPYGYFNDSTPVYITIPTPGGTNDVEEAEFRNNPDLGSITVAKFQAGTDFTQRIPGVVFRLYKDSVAPANQIGTDQTTDTNGNASWGGLYAGTYILKEISVPYGYTLPTVTETTVILTPGSTLDGGRQVVIIENEGPPTTTTPPPVPRGNTPTPTPSPTPTPVPTATPTPVNTEEITIEDVDPAFGPETGEGSGLFMTIGILLLMASALFIIRKKAVLKSK